MSARYCAALALLCVAACSSPPPNDVAEGVGFGDYATYQQRQANQAAAVRADQIAAGRISNETVQPPARAQQGGTDPLTARAAAAIAEAEAGQNAPQQTASATPATTPQPTPTGNAAISDEQSFEAVAARETIESDAERLQRMQDQMVIVQPTDLPNRPNSTGPNIIEYALATSHPVGQQVHRRSRLGAGRHEQNCLSYQSDDLAQQAFLAAGGPGRDRQALDPDGDGYACNWDPSVYRNAARSGRFTGATGTAPGSVSTTVTGSGG
ncbi:MAG: hypothetical protein AAGF68_10705 [Pseudomonadota bacterium]